MSQKKKIFPIIFSLLFVIVGAISLFMYESEELFAKKSTATSKKNKHYESKLVSINAKEFAGKKINGKNLGKGLVLLNFWATWCQPCLEEFPSLVQLRDKFKDDNFKVIAINSDEENAKKNISKVKKKYSLNFDIIEDKGAKITDEFMISSIPVSILFKDGKVVEVSDGSKDFFSIEYQEKIKKLLK